MKKIAIIIGLCFTMLLVSCDRNSSSSTSSSSPVVTYKYTDGTYDGVWQAESYGKLYSALVTVTIKDDKITSVVLKPESEIYSSPDIWNGSANWTEHVTEGLDAYKNKSAETVSQATYDLANATVSGMDKVSGATLSSGRLLAAVQNALSKAKK